LNKVNKCSFCVHGLLFVEISTGIIVGMYSI